MHLTQKIINGHSTKIIFTEGKRGKKDVHSVLPACVYIRYNLHMRYKMSTYELLLCTILNFSEKEIRNCTMETGLTPVVPTDLSVINMNIAICCEYVKVTTPLDRKGKEQY
ncbi:hypothetical protein AK88_02091 [Plasmodium fragile]|uniref:Uncharacterized protein n=1 Tax=Plasmodium fragile TaxID=5857 RepID=A0A0D9QMK2_PLAFR|nr:uncharacterized protein AK88_02091 [Plasmodium fragile]KJP88310.1 hypothetical protein AK88_02091 [Plasmodium fragile]